MNLRFWSDVTCVGGAMPLELAYPHNPKKNISFFKRIRSFFGATSKEV